MDWFEKVRAQQQQPQKGWFNQVREKPPAAAPPQGDWFAKVRARPSRTQERVVNKQHPALADSDRYLINTLADDPREIAAWLQKKGFETDLRDDEVVLRKPGERDWHQIEATGFLRGLELKDVLDLANEATQIAAMGKGAAVGAGMTSGTGPGAILGGIGGAALASGAHETARRAAAQAAGFGEGGLLKAGLRGTAEGAIAEAGGQATSKLVGAMGKRFFPKTVAARRAAQQAAKMTPEERAAVVGKESAEEVAGLTGGTTARSADDVAAGRPGRYRTTEDWEDLSVTRAKDITDPGTGRVREGYEFASPEGITRLTHEALKTSPKKLDEFIARLDDRHVHYIADQVGMRGATKKTPEQVRKWMSRNKHRVSDLLADKRLNIHDQLNASIKNIPGQRGKYSGAFYVENITREGERRTWQATLQIPPTAKPVPREMLREMLEDMHLEEARALLLRIERATVRGKKGLQARLGSKTLERIGNYDFDGIVDRVFDMQKANRNALNAIIRQPGKAGLRIVWDLNKDDWRHLALDSVMKIRFPYQTSIDYTTKAWRAAPDMWNMALRSTGTFIRDVEAVTSKLVGALGEALEHVPGGKAAAKMARRTIRPARGVAAVGTGGGSLAVEEAARGLAKVAPRLQRDTGDLMDRVIHRIPAHVIKAAGKAMHAGGADRASAVFVVWLKAHPEILSDEPDQSPRTQDTSASSPVR